MSINTKYKMEMFMKKKSAKWNQRRYKNLIWKYLTYFETSPNMASENGP